MQTNQSILSGQTERIISVTPGVWVPRLTKVLVFFTFLLIIAGALITGNKAALSDPTWPKFVGNWTPTAETFVGGIRYEDSHRVLASIVAFLMVAVTVAVHRRERNWSISGIGKIAAAAAVLQTILGGVIIYLISHEHLDAQVGLRIQVASILILLVWFVLILMKRPVQIRGLRNLAWFGLWLVINQALLGGLVIHTIRTPAVSMVHGFVAQAFFCTTLALAVFGGQRWLRSFAEPQLVRPENDSFLGLLKTGVLVAFFQVVLGTGVRHVDSNPEHLSGRALYLEPAFLSYLIAHILGAIAVISLTIFLALRARAVYNDVPVIRRGWKFALALVLSQIVLGTWSIFANRDRLQPEMAQTHHVLISTAHLMVGALILAIWFVTALRAHRVLQKGIALPQPGTSPAAPGRMEAAV